MSTSDYPLWQGLAEIDRASGCIKGSAFKAFKALEPQLREGEDYLLLGPSSHSADIARLKHSQRVYTSSINALLLSVALAQQLQKQLSAGAP